MKIKPRSKIRNKISHLLLRARKRIENEIRESFEKSGEAQFIRSFAQEYAGKHTVVFDVGANVGLWSTLVAKEVAKNNGELELHVFEPVAEYKGPGKLHKVAVSLIKGEAEFNTWDSTDQSSLYERRLTHSKQGQPKRVLVSTIRLDDYIRENHIEHIDLLKVDVEGHELNVLKSLGEYLRPDFVSIIQFEYGPTYVDSRSYLLDMYELLKEYRICKMFPGHLEETPYQSNIEDFMFTNYVALPK